MKCIPITMAFCTILLFGCDDSLLNNELNENGGNVIVNASTATISYTDNPENSYFLIRETDEAIEGKTAFVNWSNSGQQTKSTSVSDGLFNTLEISKVVNKRRAFPAFQFALDLNEQDPEVKEGEVVWYLPSKNEALLMYIFSGALNLSAQPYWTSTEWLNFSYYRDQAAILAPHILSGWAYLNKVDGYHLYNYIRQDKAAVRLVKVQDEDSKKYPYVKSKTEAIIVCRDKDGGVKEEALRRDFPLLSTTDLDDNQVSRCFEVDLNDSGHASLWEAQALAAEKGKGWRVPTLREMQLIWTMGGCYDNWGDDYAGSFKGGWGAFVPNHGLNLREVESFIPLGDALPGRVNQTIGQYLISNPNSFLWEENKVWVDYQFDSCLNGAGAGSPNGSAQTFRLVRDVVLD